MIDQSAALPTIERAERPIAAVGVGAAFGALFSAVACCVLPAALALAGLSAGGFAFVVPYHWPLTVASSVVVAVGWAVYLRKRQRCANGVCFAPHPRARATLWLLSAATLFIVLSIAWKAFFEAPLQAWLLGL